MAKTKQSSNFTKRLIKSCKILDSLIIDLILCKIDMNTFIIQLEQRNKSLSETIYNEMSYDTYLKQVFECYLHHCNNLKYYNQYVLNIRDQITL